MKEPLENELKFRSCCIHGCIFSTTYRRIKEAVHEFDHYCSISCDEEYEEKRTKKQLHAWNNNAWNFAGTQ